METLYIHGANMTARSFSLFDIPDSFCIEYDIQDGLENNVELLYHECTARTTKPINIIAHSMGGLIALGLLARKLPINKIATMSTPFGGSIASGQLKWLYPFHKVFSDTCSNSEYLKLLREQEIAIPMLSYVTTGGGNPMKYSANDGVVSVESQQHVKAEFRYSDLNHYEILMCEDVVKDISNFIK